MEELQSFNISLNRRELITIVGAGGKTTTMFDLASRLRKQNRSVLVTTTTAIFYPFTQQHDKVILEDSNMWNELKMIKKPCICVLGSRVNEEDKLIGIDKELVNRIYKENLFDFILVEGDGSKRRPIKAPAHHEPVIPELSTKVIGVIGMDALGKEINEVNVHRPELFCKLTNCSNGDVIDGDMLISLIEKENGLFKAVPSGAEKILKLNKVIEDRDKEVIEHIKGSLASLKLDIAKIVTESFRKI